MSRRNPWQVAILVVLGLWLTAGSALAQECKWCDRLAVYIKKYTYQFKPDDKAPEGQKQPINVEKVEYVTFEARPTTREVLENTPQHTQIEGLKSEANHYYFVCDYHRNLELALAFSLGDAHYKKYAPPVTEGVRFRADALGSEGETEAWYSIAGEPSETKAYIIEIANPGYAKTRVDEMVKEVGSTVDDPAAYARTNQATFRILALDLTEDKGEVREIQPPTPIAKLKDEIDVRDGGGTAFRLRFERGRRPSEDPQVAAESVRLRRESQHHFDAGTRWVVRVGADPLRRVLPRNDQYNKVKSPKEGEIHRRVLAEALGEYLDVLLSEFKELDTQREQLASRAGGNWSEPDWKTYTTLQRQLDVKAGEIEQARIHSAELQNIVFCDVNRSVPAVRIWKDFTDNDVPRVIGLSPFDGGFQKFDEQRTWDYLIPYLTVIGVILVSSVLSLVGIKSAGG